MKHNGNDGKEISIILICSERRTFGSNILSKLFSIGIYNALIGNDRSMDNLCKLINRPRTKKEAKLYYRIDQATYESAVDNGEVSETEIQNILNHFKKLGKSTDRYTDSFNNIAGQYTDDQLKLIINVLPMKVKAVLEAESPKYQSLMGTSGEERRRVAPAEPGISVNTIGSGRENNVSGPIVIPSGMKRFTGGARPIIPNNTANTAQSRPIQAGVQAQAQAPQQRQEQVQRQQLQRTQVQPRPVVQPEPVQKDTLLQNPNQSGRVIPRNMGQRQESVQEQPVQRVQRQPVVPRTFPDRPVKDADGLIRTFPDAPGAVKQRPVVQEPIVEEEPEPIVDIEEPIEEPMEEEVVPVPEVQQEQKAPSTNGQRYTGTIAQVKRTLIARRKANPVVAAPVTPVAPVVTPEPEPVEEVPEMEEEVMAEEPRRGRGRPRKPVTEEDLKPKGKRGRPRKNPLEENSLDDLLGGIGVNPEPADSEVMMPGLEDDVLPGLEDEPAEEEGMLPGLEDDFEEPVVEEEEDGFLPGLDDVEPAEEPTEDDGMLPGLEEEDDDLGVLPGLDDIEPMEEEPAGEEVDVNSLLAGLDDEEDSSASLPGLEDEPVQEEEALPGLEDDYDDYDDGMLPGLDDVEEAPEEDDGMLPGLDEDIYAEDSEEETMLPGMGFEDEVETVEDPFAMPSSDDDYDDGYINNDMDNYGSSNVQEENAIESIKPQIDYSMSNLNSLLSKDKKIVAFVGATKNGTSFLINNLALMFSMMGIDTAILDMTQNKNSYYLFTDSREELRKIAYTSLSKLENGYADGIKFNKNLTVYTGLPLDAAVYENAEPILSTLVQNHSLVLIDTDFTTPPAYFASSQEIYLVQSMDILTIQPLTAFLRDLKFKGAWEPEKARVVINKEVPIRILSNKTIIGGMSRYNGPDMSVMTDLFNKDMVKACSIPFDEKVYAKYLETLATCKLSISSLPKQFRAKLQILGEMVYPRLNSKTSYSPSPDMGGMNYNPMGNGFSNDTNNTLNKMKRKF
ncbi:MAG: hypothetical protein IJ867_08315 [Clostridia bacterium]|nr:hypothetical protein [Clostridia bacterium]